MWNAGGTAVLALTASEVDATNQSYYGEQKLSFLAADGRNDCLVPLKVAPQPQPLRTAATITYCALCTPPHALTCVVCATPDGCQSCMQQQPCLIAQQGELSKLLIRVHCSFIALCLPPTTPPHFP